MLFKLIRRQLRCTRGNMAVFLAIAAVPIMFGVGVAVDYTRGLNARSHLQSALDAATFAVATAQQNMSDSESIAVGQDVFSSNFDGKFAGITATAQLTINGQTVTGSANLDLNNAILGSFGISTLPVDAKSEVTLAGIGNAEVVFVLDYSSSMDDQYEPMRDAAKSLVNTITSGLTSTDVKIGLVPFAKYVYGTLPGQYVLGGTTGVPWTNCTVGRKWPWVWKDQTPTAATDSMWGRTDGDDDIEADEYEDCDDHPANSLIIRPLTTDHQGTIDQLDAMTPDSGTNVALGMEFAFHLISPNAPWTEGAPYTDSNWRKVVILLTDGRHNKPGFGPGSSYTEDQGSENLDLICEEIKKMGVLVISVAYELDDDEGKEQLENCATNSQYYLEGTEETIATVFNNIGGLVSQSAYFSK